MDYAKWLESVPASITGDTLWRVEAYRLAVFAADLGWADVTCLVRDRRTLGLSSQLYEAVCSVGANIAEGYSRGTGRDRARFYEYSLGSAREARDWYYKGRHVLGEAVANHRLQLLTQIIRLLLRMVPDQRGEVMREPTATYDAFPPDGEATAPGHPESQSVLQNVPLPRQAG